MSKHVYCSKCRTHIAESRDARIKVGAKIEGTCKECAKVGEVPDFLQGLFRQPKV